jgi:hypothetical protein
MQILLDFQLLTNSFSFFQVNGETNLSECLFSSFLLDVNFLFIIFNWKDHVRLLSQPPFSLFVQK